MIGGWPAKSRACTTSSAALQGALDLSRNGGAYSREGEDYAAIWGASCPRNPCRGPNWEFLIVVDSNEIRTQLMAPREAARLMGPPGS